MAQIIPPLTTLPSDSSAAPSVEDIQDRLPSICVDYLSHDWSEEDVWASWRNMTRHKHEIANGVRLENASWRTWQKQRNKLKTISPETLNWLKDSDVTWLYGPLHTANVEAVPAPKAASTDERLGIDVPVHVPGASASATGKKPILKHRTLSEMLSITMPASPILESTSRDDDDDVDMLEDGPDRPTPQRTKSDSNIFRNRNRRKSPTRNSNSTGATPGQANLNLPPLSATSSGKRHISFNTFVEQCVAIDEAEVQMSYEDDSDEDMLEMRSSNVASSSRSSISSVFTPEHLTIAKIAPTLLKVNGAYAAGPDAPQMVYAPPPEYISPPLNHPAFDFPSPAVQLQRQQQQQQPQQEPTSPWRDEDGYGSVGYEYFQGPDLGDASPSFASGASSLASSTVKGSRAITPPDTSLQNSGSSSSSSLNALGTSPSGTSQPTRSILKVRPPGAPTPPEEQVSPPATEFNYSVATGIGGMRNVGGYEYPAVSNEETRGRSAARSSSVHERSASRGTSTSSTSSISPGTGAGQATRAAPIDARGRSGSRLGGPASPGQTAPVVRPRREDEMEVDESYHPAQSDTPTPHSSPQISLRSLKDASPSSLPHTSPPILRPRDTDTDSDLPTPDAPARVDGSQATTGHVPTNAQPTMSLPAFDDDEEMMGEGGDGSSIMGRAANIANTAKDLLGALWYGANDPRAAAGQSGGQVDPQRGSVKGSGLGVQADGQAGQTGQAGIPRQWFGSGDASSQDQRRVSR
ncbi:hypothetical protein BD324DRAFT_619390 [Kockovaella imperatae]|uniref:Nitrogen regulatory protein areA GATA-like domain-containing protein n=1 Tax=Kockovaella imperatae TaxID=4999 RepID=A0A1Y1UMY3_9TREE|nr:hypothetical protein BD324DRAFT_619390 [Kockovaella imperatae]ORX39362.1 hypothetical protein BD324DRAFT_619390 [Kockovaella imperatae]